MSRALGELVRAAAGRLGEAGIAGAERDARILAAHALGIGAERVDLMHREPVDAQAAARLDGLVALRAERRPVSHITGRRAFHAHEFAVTPDVLDPRPETETLVEAALIAPFRRVLDLGTGSGAVLLSLLAARPQATGVGTDVSAPALEVARRNARALGVAARCRFAVSDWFESVEGVFDLVVSNPPYVSAEEMRGLAPELAWEPRIALTDGGDGLSCHRAVIGGAGPQLSLGGRLLVEIGPTQASAVARMFREAGFGDVRTLPDLDGRDRVVAGEMPGDGADRAG